jgi:hydrogenase expression/formation protein HypE
MKVGLPRFDGHLGVGGVGIKPNHERDHQRATKFCFAGAMAVHGIAIMSVREGLEFETEIASDTAALNTFVDAMLATARVAPVIGPS